MAAVATAAAVRAAARVRAAAVRARVVEGWATAG